jgi:phosphoribosylformylglycinamidine cyclo-ligase
MFKVFNMGHRMELYLPGILAPSIIEYAESFNIEARIIGHCEPSESRSLIIRSQDQEYYY